VTLTDEVGRQQKVYSDVLGRAWKTEVLNWDGAGPNGTGGSVYSTTVSVFNARDQVMKARQYSGAAPAEASSTNADASCPTGTCQETVVTFDGYGRLRTKHAPEQQVDPNNPASTDHTTWDYFADDTIQKVTDARGAHSTLTYNNRHLVTGITYGVLSGVPTTGPSAVAPAAAVSFGYDAAGNRTSMADGSGNTSYQYDQLSRMNSETRTINGLSGAYTIGYSYTLSNQLKTLTDPDGRTTSYDYDSTGRLAGVNGVGYNNASQFAN